MKLISNLKHSSPFLLTTTFHKFSTIIMGDGNLTFRNSQTLELHFNKLNTQTGQISSLAVPIDSKKSIVETQNVLKQAMEVQRVDFACQDQVILADVTRMASLVNRAFFIMTEKSNTLVQGQLIDSNKTWETIHQSKNISENLKNMDMPYLHQREFREYYERINIWVESQNGTHLMDDNLRIPSENARDIIVQALRDNKVSHIQKIVAEQRFLNLYWDVAELRQKKEEAKILCVGVVKKRMALGLVAIASNIGFIWSGTYVFLSWDIIEPLAYFVNSIGLIALMFQYNKLNKPYSNENYKQYLMEKNMKWASEKVGLNLDELQQKERQLKQAESIMKDLMMRNI